jgi:hypothetical protein
MGVGRHALRPTTLIMGNWGAHVANGDQVNAGPLAGGASPPRRQKRRVRV